MSTQSDKPPVPFAKILSEEYDDDQNVKHIQGTITALYEIKRGSSPKGDYEFQNGRMKDAAGTEIDISFSSNSQPTSAKGQKVTIKSTHTEQHGWNGVKVEDQTFESKGETRHKRLLKITATASIIYEGGVYSGQEKKPEGQTQSKGNVSTQPSSSAHPAPIIQDYVALHGFIENQLRQNYGDKIDPEILSRYVATVFIKATDDGLHHNFIERANAPLPPKITTPPSDPTLWETAMIPNGTMMGKTLKDLDETQLTKYYDAVKEKDNPMANCVKFGFEARGYLKKRQDAEAKAADENKALSPEDSDVPF